MHALAIATATATAACALHALSSPASFSTAKTLAFSRPPPTCFSLAGDLITS
jgi:hypothetical protein